MAQRFIARAIGAAPETVGPDTAKALLQGAVGELNACGHHWSPRGPDYVVWAHQNCQADTEV